MICTNCGKQMADNAKFCTGCGTPLAVAPQEPVYTPAAPAGGLEAILNSQKTLCPACGKELNPNAKFCTGCGAAVAAAAPVVEAVPVDVPAEPVAEAAPVEVPAEPVAEAAPVEVPGDICAACGAVLKPNAKFCIVCGATVGAGAVAEPAPVEEMPAPATEPVAEAAPVAAEPTTPCPACGAPLKPNAKFCIGCGSAVVPVAPVILPEEPAAPAEKKAPKKEKKVKEPKAPKEPKEKGGKKGLVIAIVAVVLVAVLGVGGWFGWNYYQDSKAYEAAAALAEEGDLEGAIEGFAALGDFKDSQTQVQLLEERMENLALRDEALALMEAEDLEGAIEILDELGDFEDAPELLEECVQGLVNRQTYADAMGLMDAGSLEEAKTLFESLGEYQDSQHYVTTHIPYLQAKETKLIAGDAASFQALAETFGQLGDYEESPELMLSCYAAAVEGYMAIGDEASAQACAEKLDSEDAQNLIPYLKAQQAQATAQDPAGYENAAQLFQALGSYRDCPELCSDCYLEAATQFAQNGDIEAADRCAANLNAEDADTYAQMLAEYFADDKFLNSLAESLTLRMEQELDDAFSDNAALVEVLMVLKDEPFRDQALKALYDTYLEAITNQAAAYNQEDYIAWLQAEVTCSGVLDILNADYGLFAEDATLKEYYIGLTDHYSDLLALETALTSQLFGVEAIPDETMGHYLPFENTTDLTFTLYITHDYYNGETAVGQELHEISVKPGETVKIPVAFPTEEYTDWYIDYDYAISE